MDKSTIWIISAAAGGLILIYVLLSKPAASAPGPIIYSSGLTGNQATSLALAGINAQLAEKQIGAQLTLGQQQIAAATAINSNNNSTAVIVNKANTDALTAIESLISNNNLAATENTNSTALAMNAATIAGQENIVHTQAPSAFQTGAGALGGLLKDVFGGEIGRAHV